MLATFAPSLLERRTNSYVKFSDAPDTHLKPEECLWPRSSWKHFGDGELQHQASDMGMGLDMGMGMGMDTGAGTGTGTFATGTEASTDTVDVMRGAELVRQEIKVSDGMQDVSLLVGDPGWAKKMEDQQRRFGMSYYVPDGDFCGMRQHESVFSDDALDIQMQIIDQENQRRYGDGSNL